MSEEPTRPSEIGALTAAMANGDEGAYRQFYDLYFNRLFRYMLVVVRGDEEAAREALQATMVRVVRHMRGFDSEATFWSWLTVLSKSAAVDEHRKAKRYRGLLDRFFRREPPIQTAEREPELDLTSALDSSLQALDAADRDLVERKYFAKQSVREIAVAARSTEKAIESRLVRIRRQLKELVLQELEHEKRR